ncbi:MAG: rod shape-determining protein MreD [Anaerolineae bacterium]|nr:rod shape-determining protein MreD [Anaerolineae bacterium]
MSRTLSLPILVLMVALQSGVVPQIRFSGGVPDLVLLAVLAWSVHSRLEDSVTWALVGGILHDLLSATPTGLSAIGLVLVVFFVSLLTEQVYRVGLVLMTGLVVVSTAIVQFTSYLLLWLTGVPVNLIVDFSYVIFPSLIYNLVFIWPIYWFLRIIQRRYTLDRRFFQD